MSTTYYELKLQINPNIEDLISEIFFENFDCEGIVLAEETYKDLEMVSTTQGTLRIFIRNDANVSYEDLLYDIENILDLSREEFISRGLTEFELGSWEFTLEEKQNEDWSRKWKEQWDVTHVTPHIAVVPDWIEYKPQKDEVIIKLEPGCAFGTGTHQTTQLCMKALEKYLKKGDTVADIGMGSGILSILAAKLGASFVYGCDTDETVIDVAKENALKNGVNLLNGSENRAMPIQTPPLEGGSESVIPGWGETRANHKYLRSNTQLAKILRNNATPPEKILWSYLQKSQLLGVKFRRQQPIGDYIVDFMSAGEKIIIELDGGQHNEEKSIANDRVRDSKLTSWGYTVIRIWNNEIYNNIGGVIEFLQRVITDPTRKSKIFTLPQGEGNTLSTCVQKKALAAIYDIRNQKEDDFEQTPPLEGGSESVIPGWGDNHVQGCMFELGSADKINDKFDFVCANILHFVLAEIMHDLKNIMKPGALMSLSGILDEKKQMVIDAYEKAGLELIEEIHQDQWTSFVVKRID